VNHLVLVSQEFFIREEWALDGARKRGQEIKRLRWSRRERTIPSGLRESMARMLQDLKDRERRARRLPRSLLSARTADSGSKDKATEGRADERHLEQRSPERKSRQS